MTVSVAELKAKFFAQMVYFKPSIVTNYKELEWAKDFLDVDESIFQMQKVF